MTILKELKEAFTKLTKLPAKKTFVEAICGSTFRRMLSIKDWEWAVESIPEAFKIGEILEQHEKLQAQVTELETEVNDLTDVIAKAKPTNTVDIENISYTLAVEHVDPFIRFLFQISTDSLKQTLFRLSKKYHPDVNKDKPNAEIVTKILNNVYADLKRNLEENDDSDNNDDDDEENIKYEESHYWTTAERRANGETVDTSFTDDLTEAMATMSEEEFKEFVKNKCGYKETDKKIKDLFNDDPDEIVTAWEFLVEDLVVIDDKFTCENVPYLIADDNDNSNIL